MDLLEYIKKELYYENCNELMEARLNNAINEGKAFLGQFCAGLNFEEDGQPLMLLVNYVRYSLAGNIDDFEKNYFTRLLSLSDQGQADNARTLEQLDAKVTELEVTLSDTRETNTEQDNRLTALESADAQTGTNIQNLTSSVSEINGNISQLQKEQEKQGQTIQSLDSSITDIRAEQETQNTNIQSLTSSVTEINGTITDIQAEQQTQNTNITGLSSSVTQINGTISQIQTEQEAQNTEISGLTSSVSDIQKEQETQNKDIESVQDENKKLGERVTKLEESGGGGIDPETDKRITSLEEWTTQADESIKDLEQTETSLNSRVTKLEESGAGGGGGKEYEIKYYTNNYDLLFVESVAEGQNGAYGRPPVVKLPGKYNLEPDSNRWTRYMINILQPFGKVQDDVTEDRILFGNYYQKLKTGCKIEFYKGNELLGTSETYTGEAPFLGKIGGKVDSPVDTSTLTDDQGNAFVGWVPDIGGRFSDGRSTAFFKTIFEEKEISDDWPTIISHAKDGTYKDHYCIGNYKAVDLGELGSINMQIAGFDVDELADGTGKASISFVAKELLADPQDYNPPEEKTPGTLTDFGKRWKLEKGVWNFQPLNGFAYTDKTASFLVSKGIPMKIDYSTEALGLDTYTLEIDGKPLDTKELDGSEDVTITASAELVDGLDYREKHFFIQFDDPTRITASIDNLKIPAGISYKDGTGKVGGWEKCQLRKYLNETVLPAIPSPVKEVIKPVLKWQEAQEKRSVHELAEPRNVDVIQETTDSIWVPSIFEVDGRGEASTGPYSYLFKPWLAMGPSPLPIDGKSWYLRDFNSDQNITGEYVRFGFCI